MNQTHTLRNLAAVLLGRLRFIIICTLLFGAAALLAARLWIPFRYEAYASLYVRNSGLTAAQSNRNGNVNLNDLNASKSLVDTYIAVLTSQTVMNEVSRQLCATLDEETLRTAFPGAGPDNPPNVLKCLRMSAVNGTEVMRITANTRSPEASARICNILVGIAPESLIRVVGAGSVEVIDEAAPIYKAVSPNLYLVTAIGLFLGLVAGVATVLLFDFFDDTVKDAEKLSRTFSRPILGEIQNADADEKESFPNRALTFWRAFAPVKRRRRRRRDTAYRRDGKGSRRSRRKLITDENIPFNIVEGYKSIRTNAVFSLGTARHKIIVVSSATPHEGKSTTAANIALAFAQISKRVLLVDADMRKPVMHRTFTVDNITGLSTLIISLSTEEESIRRRVMGDLDLLPSGPIPPNPSELLSSEQFREVLGRLAEQYDYIIIDTPPVNVVSDALSIRDVGGVLLVVRYAQATYEDLAEAMKKMNLSGANALGFVLNDVERRPVGGYYRYGRYGYYGYGYSRRRKSGVSVGAEADGRRTSEADKRRTPDAGKRRTPDADKRRTSDTDAGKRGTSEADKRRTPEAGKRGTPDTDAESASEGDGRKSSETDADRRSAREAPDAGSASEGNGQRTSEATPDAQRIFHENAQRVFNANTRRAPDAPFPSDDNALFDAWISPPRNPA